MSSSGPTEDLFDQALDIAEKHLGHALREGAAAAPYVTVAMIEAAVNQAVAATSPEDVIAILQDLIDQIEAESLADDGASDGE